MKPKSLSDVRQEFYRKSIGFARNFFSFFASSLYLFARVKTSKLSTFSGALYIFFLFAFIILFRVVSSAEEQNITITLSRASLHYAHTYLHPNHNKCWGIYWLISSCATMVLCLARSLCTVKKKKVFIEIGKHFFLRSCFSVNARTAIAFSWILKSTLCCWFFFFLWKKERTIIVKYLYPFARILFK